MAPNARRRLTTSFISLATLCALTLAIALCAPAVCRAQGTSPRRGFSPGASYSISEIESINKTNGNLGLQIPLANLPAGRGGFPGFGLRLVYNSKVWDTPISVVPDGTYDNYGQPRGTPQNFLKASAEGGWRYGAGYEVRLVNRLDQYTYSPLAPSCENQWGTTSHDADYIYKVQVIFPDGSAHEFVPQGYQSPYNTTGDGYYNIRPDGYLIYCSCHSVWGSQRPSCATPTPTTLSNAGTMTYYSTDGTYARLEFPHDSDNNPWNNSWTIYMPDGTRVVGSGLTGVGGGLPPGSPGSERVYDRNNNYADIQITNNFISITDQLNRSVSVQRNASPGVDYVSATGFGGAPLTWTVRWKSVYVRKTYNSASSGCPASMSCTSNLNWALKVIDRIELPVQAGGLAYSFGYNGSLDSNATTSAGWGELSSVTLPSGASSSYTYKQDNQNNIAWDLVLQNHPTTKSLTYLQQYDNSSSQATEVWTYSFNFPTRDSVSTSTSVTAPDGGVTTDDNVFYGNSAPLYDHGLPYRTTGPDGTVVERTWGSNTPYGHYGLAVNAYLKREFTSVRDAAGNLSKTAIKDYDYDKNGNLTRVSEYDWAPYSTVPRDAAGRPAGIPAGLQPKKVTLNTYYGATPSASVANPPDDPDSYSRAGSAALRSAIESSEVSGSAEGTVSRVEYYYDNPSTTGNLTDQRSWDSASGGLTRPLTASNWVRTTNQYDGFGNRTLATDARGYQTQFVYGPVGVFSDLYPTVVREAFGTGVQRTSYKEYDIYTGLTTRVTDADNNVSTSTAYDAFGRPTLVVAAENKPEETRTSTSYDDAARRVTVRSDLNAVGDGKLVTVQHYDQLGRIRLARTLEDASTQGEADETAGIKVQTRYRYGNATTDPYSYTIVSNPYRAATSASAVSEATMGWTRTRADRGGRVVQTQTFAGAALPAPWGGNASSTGVVATAYDAEFGTITDQAGRPRRSVTDGLGRVTRVDEPDASNNLGPTSAPVQPTSYAYDPLGDLRAVTQGQQTRTFAYNSLGRLTSATNPEGGTVNYSYDPNGNLTSRTDARGVTTNYQYDELNRNTTVRYVNDPAGTPGVNRYYDGAAGGKGRPWWTETVGVVATVFDSYDALGRPTQYRQNFWVNGAWGKSFNVRRAYNRAGAPTSQTYPSGRAVSYGYDAAGRLSGFTGNLGDGVQRVYSTGVSYAPAGAIQQEQFGTQTPLYHKRHYNRRGQLFDVRLSTAPWATDQWNWNRGALVNYYSSNYAWEGDPNTPPAPDNNGNLLRQQYWVPADDAVSNYAYTQDTFAYDSLNRITSVSELHGGPWGQSGADFVQAYDYDRWGNRTINAGSWGVNATQFDKAEAQYNNRLYAPGDTALPMGQRRMQYDAAGNLTYDTYTGQGARVYDGENRIKQAQDVYQNWSSYTYDGDGHRVKRLSANQETWQVYGPGGELLAEYRAGAAPLTSTKEYGYRGGELLVTMSSGDDQRLKRFVTYLYYGALQRDPTAQELQDASSQLADAGAQGQAQLLQKAKEVARGLFLQTAYETSPSRSDAQYVTDLYYAYLQRGPDDSGLGWWTPKVPTDGRPSVCNSFQESSEFAALVASLYGAATSDNQRTEQFVTDFYLGAYGRFPTPTELQQQRDALNAAAAQGLSQAQAQAEALGRALFAAQVNDYSITDQQFVTNLYEGFLQRGPDTGGLNFWTGNASGGPQRRQNVLNSFATSPPFRELSGTLYRETFWLVADQLGTPRMVVDKSGSLAGVKRHDYLPFGEEVGAGTGGRTPQQGYVAGDNVRQKFASYERDNESGLDYAKARYYASTQGRFTSVDPLMASGRPELPQSWNRYAYVRNNPLKLNDPDGTVDGDPNKPKVVVVLFTGGHWSIRASESGGPDTGQIIRIREGGSTKGLGEESTSDTEQMSMGQKIKNDFPNAEVIVAGPDAQPKLFNELANTDTSKGPDHVIIYGFSMGGVSAVALSNNLTRNGQTVDQLITVDPAGKGGGQFGNAPLRNGDKVKDSVNFTEYPPLNAEVDGVKNVYINGSNKANPNTPLNHTNLDDITSPQVVKRIEDRLRQISP